MTWTEETRARLEAAIEGDTGRLLFADIRAALAEIDRLSKLCCVCDGDCCRLARERKAELDRLVEMAGDWIGTDPSLRSTACIEVAISHAREQERELDRQRERAEHLHEIGVRQHARAEQAEAEVARLRAEVQRRHEQALVADQSCRDAEARVRTLEEALGGLLGAVDDVLRGWKAHQKLAQGFKGMGHNILTESAGLYGSMSCWLRVERKAEMASAALRGGE